MKLIAAISMALLWIAPAFAIEICEGGNRKARKVTCVVDGDTGWERGVKWRSSGWDTPEYEGHAECKAETIIADEATRRVQSLMSRGYEIVWQNKKGGYQRELVTIRLSDGRMLGDVLMDEGLAVKWPHRPRVWCGG